LGPQTAFLAGGPGFPGPLLRCMPGPPFGLDSPLSGPEIAENPGHSCPVPGR